MNDFPTTAIRVTESIALRLVSHFVKESQWVAVMPLPDGLYSVSVREENHRRLLNVAALVTVIGGQE